MANSTALVYRNLADAATVTAGSAIAATPAANLKHKLVSRVWRSAVSVTSSAIIVDFGTLTTIDFVGLFGVNFSASADIVVKLSSVNGTGDSAVYNSGTLNTVNAPFRRFAHFFTSAAARYVRIEISDTSLTYLEAGRVWIGQSFRPTRAYQYGWTQGIQRAADTLTSAGGQLWVDEQYDQEVIRARYPSLTRTEIESHLDEFNQYSGQYRDLVFCRNLNDAENISRQTILGVVRSQSQVSNPLPGLFDMEFELMERR